MMDATTIRPKIISSQISERNNHKLSRVFRRSHSILEAAPPSCGIPFRDGNDKSDRNQAQGRHYQGHLKHWVCLHPNGY
jgi:hypothetical protein